MIFLLSFLFHFIELNDVINVSYNNNIDETN